MSDQDVRNYYETITKPKLSKELDISSDELKTIKQILNMDNFKGWTFRTKQQSKTAIRFYLQRSSQCNKYCSDCDKDHDKDNTMYIELKNSTYYYGCI